MLVGGKVARNQDWSTRPLPNSILTASALPGFHPTSTLPHPGLSIAPTSASAEYPGMSLSPPTQHPHRDQVHLWWLCFESACLEKESHGHPWRSESEVLFSEPVYLTAQLQGCVRGLADVCYSWDCGASSCPSGAGPDSQRLPPPLSHFGKL